MSFETPNQPERITVSAAALKRRRFGTEDYQLGAASGAACGTELKSDLKAISGFADGEQVARLRGIRFQLVPQARDVLVDGA